MKRRLAWLLAACLFVQTPLATVHAEENVLETQVTAQEGTNEESEIREGNEGESGEISEESEDDTNVLEQEKTEITTETKEEDAEGETIESEGQNQEEAAIEASVVGISLDEIFENIENGTVEDTGISTQANVEHVGALTVEMVSTLPITNVDDYWNQISAVLIQNGSEVMHGTFQNEKDVEGKGKVRLEEVPVGTYQLRVTGDGYYYTQEVEIKEMHHKIKLADMTTAIDTDSSVKHLGTYGYGDLNEDGDADDKDQTLLVNAISTNNTATLYDLTKDGVVDLLDLQCFTYSRQGSVTEASVTEAILVTEASVKTELGSATTLTSGDKVSDVLTGKGSITLGTSNGQEISDTNPVEVTMDLSSLQNQNISGFTIEQPVDTENAIQKGEVTVEYTDENGVEDSVTLTISKTKTFSLARLLSAATISYDADGTIVIDLGKQVAIKKITIKVTSTGSTKLCDIAKVEFLNDMESRIPAPSLGIPDNIKITPANKAFTVSWKAQDNVAGYQVEMTYNGKSVVLPAYVNRITISSFGTEKLKNNEVYQIRVRSFNGEWKSAYSDVVDAVPKPDAKPYAPENVSVKGGYRYLDISWKKMEDTDSYTLYYRVQGTGSYQSISNITTNSYRLADLLTNTTYEIYLTGTNDLGTSPNSAVAVGTTEDIVAPITTNYKLINTSNGEGKPTAHIASVQYDYSQPSDPYTIVDNDYTTVWKYASWDAGGFNVGKRSPIVEFDQVYEMDHIIAVPDAAQEGTYSYVITQYWDENGTVATATGTVAKKTSSNGKTYYEIWYTNPFRAKKVQVNFAQYSASVNSISIAEMKFYYYDSIEDDIDQLYSDTLHIKLADGVTKEMIDALENRVNTTDSVSGEYHPRRDRLLKEIENARQLLAGTTLTDPMTVDTSLLKSKDAYVGFSAGINAWQPLGITAHQGEELEIFVGKENTTLGAATNVRLIATQYHAESSGWYSVVAANLVQGKNTVTIPKIVSTNVEHGGSLYIEYFGQAGVNIQVRVSGGTKIPVLNTSKMTNEATKKAAIRTYLTELETYVSEIESNHNQYHLNQPSTNCNYAYDKENCIFGATEIVQDVMMYSVSASQIWAGLLSKTSMDDKVDALYQSMEAMDQMINLFYQHKGLTRSTVPSEYGTSNAFPVSRQNIRYMRMFGNAFMYAGGLHIGIQWGSIAGLTSAVPIQSDNGKYKSGSFFGWGIAHEIGHIINQSQYAIAEVTNNYFSVLAQAQETNGSVRFSYDKVYQKVTSGTVGMDSNVFTSLGMYWQLHLAYDDVYNYTVFDNYDTQFKSLFFARVDAYARNTALAKTITGTTLTLDGADSDNKLMRLACAAAKKNLLDFFIAWGKTPNEATIAYASQFEKETRKIQYITDEARVYRVDTKNNNAAQGTTVTVNKSYTDNTNQVTLTLSNNASDPTGMLGYEIYRNDTVIGFVAANGTAQVTFTDTIATLNNRVFTYKVIGYDKCLNQTQAVTLDAFKVSHDGSVSKSLWSVSTNMTSESDTTETGGNDNPEPSTISAITAIYDNDTATTYTGTTTQTQAQIIVNLNEQLTLCGFKVTAAASSLNRMSKYEVFVSLDGTNWTSVKSGTLDYKEGEVATAYFDKDNDSKLYMYDASYVKIVATGQKTLTIQELDLLGPSGDNVELMESGIGTLSANYTYDASITDGYIPAGSLVITGVYKGNPAYNAVKLYDQDNNFIEGVQVIFADMPKDGQLGDISSGTWIYYIPSPTSIPTKIRAELYRVDDATSSTGERLVSDTVFVNVPSSLPNLTLTNKK
jgi:hypothetical protein